MTAIVELCDNSFNKLHELETGTFEGTVRHNEPGSWRVDCQLDEVPPDKLFGVQAVLVRDESRILFAGYRRAGDSGQGGTLRSIDETGRRCSLEGLDCWYWFTSRVCFPDPATDEPWSVASNVRSGTGSTVIAGFINDNVGVSALAGRQVPGLTVNTASPGQNIEQSARLQQLSEVVRQAAQKAGLVVEPTLTNPISRIPYVEIRERTDKTAEVVIADIADLAYAEQRDVPSRSTWVLAAGTGAGTSRMFRSYDGTSGTGVARIERVVENTTVTTSTELFQYAKAVRAEDGFAFYVSGRTNEKAAEQYRFLEDYRLGDLITVQVSGIRFEVPVTAVTITVSPDREVQTPTLGIYTPDRLRGVRKDLLELDERFADNIA